jgi:hypothetical protein
MHCRNLSPEIFSVVKAQPALLKALGIFIKDFALAPLPIQNLTPLELEKFNKYKVFVVL